MIVVDVPVSAIGLAVQNIAKEQKKMMITHSTGAADFHGRFCSPYTMQWVFDTRALAVGTAQEVVKRGGDTWFFLTADYAFGHSLEPQASEVIRANGGKVLGAVRHPCYGELSRGAERSSPRQFFPDCTIAMCGYDFREGQVVLDAAVIILSSLLARGRAARLLVGRLGSNRQRISTVVGDAAASEARPI
jgi:hypothetical protein